MKREVVKLYPHSDAFSLWREMDSLELKKGSRNGGLLLLEVRKARGKG